MTHLTTEDLQKLVDSMREAYALYEKCGVEGVEGARQMKEGADAIEALRERVKELEGEEWQDIVTGPRDKTIVEGRHWRGAVSRVYFDKTFGGGGWCFACPNGVFAGKAVGIEHWRPLKGERP